MMTSPIVRDAERRAAGISEVAWAASHAAPTLSFGQLYNKTLLGASVAPTYLKMVLKANGAAQKPLKWADKLTSFVERYNALPPISQWIKSPGKSYESLLDRLIELQKSVAGYLREQKPAGWDEKLSELFYRELADHRNAWSRLQSMMKHGLDQPGTSMYDVQQEIFKATGISPADLGKDVGVRSEKVFNKKDVADVLAKAMTQAKSEVPSAKWSTGVMGNAYQLKAVFSSGRSASLLTQTTTLERAAEWTVPKGSGNAEKTGTGLTRFLKACAKYASTLE